MLSPGEAFLLAYLPSRHATLLARKVLLERLSPTLGPKRGIEALAGSPNLRALDTVNLGANKHEPVDQLHYYDDDNAVRVPTEAGKALEAKYGRLAWLHPEPS